MSRKQHWESVYTKKSTDQVSWFQNDPSLSLELIRNSGIEKNAPLIDVGSGASRLIDALVADEYQDITALDISANALQHTRARVGENAPVTWIETDVTEFFAIRHYALWHDRAVFHFLTAAEDRLRYIDNLRRALGAEGHVIIASFALDGPEKCSDLPVERYDAEKISAVLGDEFRLQATRHELHNTPADKQQSFNYFYFHYTAQAT